VVMVPKFALVCAPVAKLYVSDEFGFDGLKWLNVLKVSIRSCSTRDSEPSRTSFERLRSQLTKPGPYVSVGGVFPIPKDSAGGNAKLVCANGYQSRGSAVDLTEDGVAPPGSHRSPVIWQRNGTP